MTTPESPDATLTAPPPPLHVRFWLSLRFGVLRKLLVVWAITIVVSILTLYVVQTYRLQPAEPMVALWGWPFFTIAIMALVCEYMDSTLGMGYGTTLTPVLLILPFGLDPLQVVPAILISELITGIAGALSHQEAGNINLRLGSPHLKVAMVLGACSMVGAVVAVHVAVNISKLALTLIIGIIVLAMGIIILATRGERFRFSWRKILALGLVASFNKGLSGGGYGPLVMGGQLLSGVGGKQAIGITSLAEGLTCLVGVILFVIAGKMTDLSLSLALVIGAVSSLPFCAYTVRKMTQRWLTLAIAVLTIILGSVTILKAFDIL